MLQYKLNIQPSGKTAEMSVANGTIATGDTLYLSDDYSMLSGTTTKDMIGLSSSQHVTVVRGLMRAGATLDYENTTRKFRVTLDEMDTRVDYTDLVVVKETRYLIYDTETKVQVVERDTTDYYTNLPGQPKYYVNIDNNVIEIQLKSDDLGNEYTEIDGLTYPIVKDSEGSMSGHSLKLYTASKVLHVGDMLRAYATTQYNDYVISPGQQFVFIVDSWYPIEANLAYECTISGNTIELVKDNPTGNTYHSNIDPGFTFTESGGTLSYLAVSGTSTLTMTTTLVSYSGVTYEDKDYIIRPQTIGMAGGSKVTIDVVRIPSALIANLKVTHVDEPNCYTLAPDSLYDDAAYTYILDVFRNACSYIAQNPGKVIITLHNGILGQKRITYGENLQEVIDNLHIIIPATGYEIPLLFSNENPLNLNQEHRLNNEYENLVEGNLLKEKRNQIIDMDYDMYTPGYHTGSTQYEKDVPSNFLDVNEVRFNLHFRTRDLETGQVIEDDKNPYTHDRCNWFVTDYYDPDSLTKKATTGATAAYDKLCEDLVQSGDLLGFIGFSDDDVRYQKERLAKSFLRLSFYDSNDYTTQSLLYHTTIFMNEGECYGKFMNNNNSDSLFVSLSSKLAGTVDLNACDTSLGFSDYFAFDEKTFCQIQGVTAQTAGDLIQVQTYRVNIANAILLKAGVGDIVVIGNTIANTGFYVIEKILQPQPFVTPPGQYILRLLCCGNSHKAMYNNSRLKLPLSIRVVKELSGQAGVLTEKVNTCVLNPGPMPFLPSTSYNTPPTLNLDDNRISTQLKTYKNTEHEKCSDGFYLHLFKEYATALHKRTIYMKVEFNNAANGHTSQFMLLKDGQGQMVKSLKDITPEMKEGYDTRVMYKHVFIPIEVIYDRVKKRYTYYFEDNYSDVMTFNLFEVKYAYGKFVPGGGSNKSMVEVTVRPNDFNLGICDGSGYYFSGDTVTISASTAINNACWMGWADLDESDPDKFATARTITVGSGDTVYMGNFEKYYRVHLHTNDTFSGDTLLKKSGDIMLGITDASGTTLTGITQGDFTYHPDLSSIVIDRSETGTTRHMIPTYDYATGVTASGFYLCPVTTAQPGHTMTIGSLHCIQCFDGDIFVRATDKLKMKFTGHIPFSLDTVQLNGSALQPVAGTTDEFETYITEDSDITAYFNEATAHVKISNSGHCINQQYAPGAKIDYNDAGEAYATTGVTPGGQVNRYVEFDIPLYSTITLTAATAQGIASAFDCWSVSNMQSTSSTNPYTITVTEDVDIVAFFDVTGINVFYSFTGDTGVTGISNVYNTISDGTDTFNAVAAIGTNHKTYISGTTQNYTISTDGMHELKVCEIRETNGQGLHTLVGTEQFQLLLRTFLPQTQPSSGLSIKTILKDKLYRLSITSPTTSIFILGQINGAVVQFDLGPVDLPPGTVITNIHASGVGDTQMLKWSDGCFGATHPDITMNEDMTITTSI